jgi:hypothetical protein
MRLNVHDQLGEFAALEQRENLGEWMELHCLPLNQRTDRR